MPALWEHRKINAAGSWTYNSSVDFVLPSQGMLSSLQIIGSATPANDARNALEKWRFMDYVNSIVVTAGGAEPFKNLTGRLAHAEQYYDGGPGMLQQYFNYGTSTERWRTVINFGRWFKDTGYGLDLSKIPQTKMTLTNDAVVGIYSAVATPTVIATFLYGGGGVNWNQYCQSKTYQTILTVQNGNYAVKFPQLGILRRFLLQVDPYCTTAANADTQLYNAINNLLLTHRSGQDILWNDTPRNLWTNDAFERGRDLFQGAEPYFTSGYGIRTGLGQTLYKAGIAIPQAGTQPANAPSLEPGDDSSTQKYICSTLHDTVSMLFAGYGIENTFPYRYDQYDDVSACPDLAAVKDVDLALTSSNDSSSANATVRVQLDRIMGY
jgi:hypothetical protein